MYARAVATDVNDLESRRHKGEELRHVLMELVQSDVRLCRECVLTAFCLLPTLQRLDRLVKISELSVTPPSPSSYTGGGFDSRPPSQCKLYEQVPGQQYRLQPMRSHPTRRAGQFYGTEKGYENLIVDWDRQEQPDPERNDKVPALAQLQSTLPIDNYGLK